jgi:hypothetical protein
VLGGGELEVEVERLGESVFVLQQLRGKVVGLVGPHASGVEGLEPT